MKIFKAISFLFLIGSAIASHALTASDLQFQNKPIDPRCFESNGTVPFGECTHNDTSTEKVSGQNDFLTSKGYIGADYVSTTNDKFPAGYSYYKVIGMVNGEYIVYTINSGGGSGEFTAVKSVKLEKDQLQIQTIKAGDRCNGGVSDVELKNNVLTYQVNVTPYDLIDLSGNNTLLFQAYDDIGACAVCCIGKATYKSNLSTDSSQGNLISVQLGKDYQLDTFNGSKQVCFNKVLFNFMKGKQSLNPEELKQFVAQLDKVCR